MIPKMKIETISYTLYCEWLNAHKMDVINAAPIFPTVDSERLEYRKPLKKSSSKSGPMIINETKNRAG